MMVLGCDALWTPTLVENPRNCVATPAACAPGEWCNPVSELCERLPLRLDSVSPAQVPRSGRTLLTLRGEGFLPGVMVEVAGTQIPAGQLEIVSTQELRFPAPAGATACGRVPVAVRGPGGERVMRADLLRYTLAQLAFGSVRSVRAAGTSSRSYWTEALDLNHDGALDLVTLMNDESVPSRSSVATLLGRGDGTFSPFLSAPLGQGAFSFAVMDWDRDGNQDVLAASFSGEVLFLAGQGDGRMALRLPNINPKVGSLTGIVPLDLGADRPPAAVVIGSALVRLQNQSGQVSSLQGPSLASSAQLASLGDIDQDGRADIVVAYYNLEHPADVFFGIGDGTFLSAIPLPVSGAFVGATVADLNGDERPDIALSSPYSSSVTVLLNHGNGAYGAPQLLGSSRSRVTRFGDLDCDGDPDAVVTGEGSSQVSIFLNRGDGRFSAAQGLQLPAGAYSVAIADLSGDGVPDLGFGMIGSTDVAILVNAAR